MTQQSNNQTLGVASDNVIEFPQQDENPMILNSQQLDELTEDLNVYRLYILGQLKAFAGYDDDKVIKVKAGQYINLLSAFINLSVLQDHRTAVLEQEISQLNDLFFDDNK